ncbi:hypothetical protein KFE25_007524 [Diacronema lutheri]|uniref:PFU domain-containing protein n=1 Tax=Diacronema lutheri TaxID=2081491 RepID=A0A8J5XU44_DIALT|nr:hypothetical protein KFE25_007524 [Diacronema lutheri]
MAVQAESAENSSEALSAEELLARIDQAEARLRESIAARGAGVVRPPAPPNAPANRALEPRAPAERLGVRAQPTGASAGAAELDETRSWNTPHDGRPTATGESARKLLLIMSIDIGDGRSASIEIRQGDTAGPLADAFAREHGLGAFARDTLCAHVELHLAQLGAERAHGAVTEPFGATTRALDGPVSNESADERESGGHVDAHGGCGGSDAPGGSRPGSTAGWVPTGASGIARGADSPSCDELRAPSDWSDESEAGGPGRAASRRAAASSDGGGRAACASGGGAACDGREWRGATVDGAPSSDATHARETHARAERVLASEPVPLQRAESATREAGRDGDGQLQISRQLRDAIAGAARAPHASSATAPSPGAAHASSMGSASAAPPSWLEHNERRASALERRRGVLPGSARAVSAGSRAVPEPAVADARARARSPPWPPVHERLLAEGEQRRARVAAVRERVERERAERLDESRVSPPARSAAFVAARRAAEARVGGTPAGEPPPRARSAGERLHALSAQTSARLDAKREAWRLHRKAEEARARESKLARSPGSQRSASAANRPPPWVALDADRAKSVREREAAIAKAEVAQMRECTFRPYVSSRSTAFAARRAAEADGARTDGAARDGAPVGPDGAGPDGAGPDGAGPDGAGRSAAGARPAQRRARSAGPASRAESATGAFAGLVADADRRRREAAVRADAERADADARERQYRGEAARARALSPAREEHLRKLAYSRHISEQEVEQLRAYLNQPVDHATGRPFFTPAVNAAPVVGRESVPGDGAVFSILYEAAQARAEKLDAMVSEADASAREQARVRVQRRRSQHLAAGARKRGLVPLFRALEGATSHGLGVDELAAMLRDGLAPPAPVGPDERKAQRLVPDSACVDMLAVRWTELACALDACGAPEALADDLRALLLEVAPVAPPLGATAAMRARAARARHVAGAPAAAPADAPAAEATPEASCPEGSAPGSQHWLTFAQLVGALAPRARELAAARGGGRGVRHVLGVVSARAERTTSAQAAPGGRAFQPEIRDASRAQALERRARLGEVGDFSGRLYDEHNRKLRALAELRDRQREKEMAGLRFAPEINRQSHNLTRKASAPEGDIFSRLYAPKPLPHCAPQSTPDTDVAAGNPNAAKRIARGEPPSPSRGATRPGSAPAPAPARRARSPGGAAAHSSTSMRHEPSSPPSGGAARRVSPSANLSRQLARLMSPFAQVPTAQLEELHVPSSQRPRYASRADVGGGAGGSLAARLQLAAETPVPTVRGARASGSAFASFSPTLTTPQPPGFATAAPEADGTLQEIEDRFYSALALRLGARP